MCCSKSRRPRRWPTDDLAGHAARTREGALHHLAFAVQRRGRGGDARGSPARRSAARHRLEGGRAPLASRARTGSGSSAALACSIPASTPSRSSPASCRPRSSCATPSWPIRRTATCRSRPRWSSRRPARPMARRRSTADFDWRQTGDQSWNIDIATEDGPTLRLTHGGSKLAVDGARRRRADGRIRGHLPPLRRASRRARAGRHGAVRHSSPMPSWSARRLTDRPVRRIG